MSMGSRLHQATSRSDGARAQLHRKLSSIGSDVDAAIIVEVSRDEIPRILLERHPKNMRNIHKFTASQI